MRAKVWGEVTWGDLATSGILLLLVMIAGVAVRAWLDVLKRRQAAKEGGAGWRMETVSAVAKPLLGLIWLYGIVAAVLPLVVKIDDRNELRVQFALEKIIDIGVFALVVWLFYRFTHVLNARLLQWATKSKIKIDDVIIPPLVKTLRVALPLLGVILCLPILDLPPDYDYVVGKITSLLLIAVVAWVLFQGVHAGEAFLLAQHDTQAADNLEARKVHTQVRVLGKTIYFIIIIFTLASMLMVFEEVRRFGTNILASAGVVGIVLGFAAQRTIANLFAGFQIAMAQPIRLDDVLVVEGEWGRVEEITLTYVVVKIWDDRRLILPLSYFIEKPFQNWTRSSAQILGSVFLWMDYTVPVDEIRKEAKRLVEHHPKWDKRFWNVQITDTTDRAVQVRVLMTAATSGMAWDMRCDVREGLIAFLQKNHPGALPKVRAELSNFADKSLGGNGGNLPPPESGLKIQGA